MSADKENNYFDSLCELDQELNTNHDVLQDTLVTLKKLTEDTATDAELLRLLEALSSNYNKLVDSSTGLLYEKFKTREDEVADSNRLEIENREYILGTKNIPDMRQFVTYFEDINRDAIEYMNLLNKLSVDLVRQVDISDPDVSEFTFKNWNPPEELQKVIDEYSEAGDESSTELNIKFKAYFDQIKLSRAKYNLENKYILQKQLENLNKEVNYWRSELDKMEVMLFGDGPHSIKRMLRNVDSLKEKLGVNNV